MLPFTKRPGRGGEDGEVFTKNDLDDLAATNEKPANAAASSRSVAPPPVSVRPGSAKPEHFGDDEVTNFIPSGSISAIVHDARKPASIPPPPASRRPPASVPPPPLSQRPGKFLTGADEDEDGRTVVRGAPKIVKKSVPPAPMSSASSMSPAAVIKATLESARAAKRAHEGALMPPPPAELLEDMTDRLAPDDPRHVLASRSRSLAQANHPVPPPPQSQRPQTMQSPYTAPMGMQPVGVSELGATMLAGMGPNGPQSLPPASSHGPMTGPPPPVHLAHGYPPPSGNIPPPSQSYRPPSSYGSASQTGPQQQMGASSMPAHFMVPNAPYSDGRMDPPGTSVTARHRTPGRPASAWAMALVAAGLFVGVGAVAVMQSNDSLMDTTASFVDPSRAGTKAGGPAGAAAQPAAEAAPQATTAVAPAVNVPLVPPAANDPPAAPPPVANNAPPSTGGVLGASTPPATTSAPAAPEAKPDPKAGAVAANNPAPPAVNAPKAPWAVPAQPTQKPQAPVAAPPPPVVKPVATAKPAVASNDDPPTDKPKGGKGPKANAKSDATDEETKKALEALQKAQLESGF